MKKIIFLMAGMLPFLLMAQGMKRLSVEEDTDGGIGVYPCGERHEAMVQFVTSEPFGLEFSSNYDKDLQVTVDSVAGKKTYSIVFVTQAPGVSYDGRRLTVMVNGFKNYVMTLNLRDKQKFIYQVSDPYSALRSPYFVYQDKANELFYEGQYQGAKDNYQMIRVCPEYQLNKESIDERIVLCDSMIQWSMQAMKCEQFARFSEAADIYRKMLYYNSSSKQLSDRIGHCQAAYFNDCQNEYTLAEHYMDIGEEQSAKASYQRIVDKKCSLYLEEATAALKSLQSHDNKVAQHARCFFYEYADNMPFGFTYAQCYTEKRRSSGYISFHMNKADVKLMQGDKSLDGNLITAKSPLSWDYTDKYKANAQGYYQPEDFDHEASLSFGWTIRLWRYFFLHLGTGYHGGGFYTFDDNSAQGAINSWKTVHRTFDPSTEPFSSWNDDLRNDCIKTNWFNGAVGEGGLIAKVWRVNAKVTYQYTYWLDKGHYKDFLNDHVGTLYFGLGFNW